MSSFLASLLTWILGQVLVSGLLFCFYAVFKQRLKNANDRFAVLKIAVPLLPFLPLAAIPVMPRGETVLLAPEVSYAVVRAGIEATAESSTTGIWLISLLVVACAIASLTSFFLLLRSLIKLNRLAKRGEHFGDYKGISLLAHEMTMPPATVGCFRPQILLPRSLLSNASPEQLDMVLAHEAIHVDRRDYALQILVRSVQALLAFSPFIHWLAQWFSEEMELSCDAKLLSESKFSSRDYGNLLLTLSTSESFAVEANQGAVYMSQSIVARRIHAMRDLATISSPWKVAIVFTGFLVAAIPILRVFGLDQLEMAMAASGSESKHSYLYSLRVTSADGKSETLSGSFVLPTDGKHVIESTTLQIQVSYSMEAEHQKFQITTVDKATAKVIATNQVITDGAGFQVSQGSDASNGFGAYSLSISPPAKTAAPSAIVDGDQVRLNFREGSRLTDVIKGMAKITGRNIVLEKGLDAEVQMVSPESVTRKEAYQAFQSLLKKLDLETVDEGKFLKVVAAKAP